MTRFWQHREGSSLSWGGRDRDGQQSMKEDMAKSRTGSVCLPCETGPSDYFSKNRVAYFCSSPTSMVSGAETTYVVVLGEAREGGSASA